MAVEGKEWRTTGFLCYEPFTWETWSSSRCCSGFVLPGQWSDPNDSVFFLKTRAFACWWQQVSQNRLCALLSETQLILLLVSLKIYHPSRSQNGETGPCLAAEESCPPGSWLFGQRGSQWRSWHGALSCTCTSYQKYVEMNLFRAQGKSEVAVLATASWEADTLLFQPLLFYVCCPDEFRRR